MRKGGSNEALCIEAAGGENEIFLLVMINNVNQPAAFEADIFI